MRPTFLSVSLIGLLILPISVLLSRPAHAQNETVLYSFGGQTGDGMYPDAGLVFDKKGNLYGTTNQGGPKGPADGSGTVFELTSEGTEKVLYSFCSQPDCADGGYPNAGLIFDKKGNLYGTTGDGGGGGRDFGTVFELTSEGTEKVLYSFDGGLSGAESSGNLVFDKKGNLYGTTYWGGTQNYGTVFELNSEGEETVLHSFIGPPGDGFYPIAGLVFDKKGNLYGTTPGGGETGQGAVFELTSEGTEKLLYSFGSYSGDAEGPDAGLIFDKKDNLYGTTCVGGAKNYGTVFELTSEGTEKVLYSFGSQSGDGHCPYTGSLVFDKKGNLYGETVHGGPDGCIDGCGTLFELTSDGTEKVLYSFGSQSGDGCYPQGGLVLDEKGNLYGTTFECGEWDFGTVFKVVP
jgi:uncharacterized repeat protein (TIGR03803 family)